MTTGLLRSSIFWLGPQLSIHPLAAQVRSNLFGATTKNTTTGLLRSSPICLVPQLRIRPQDCSCVGCCHLQLVWFLLPPSPFHNYPVTNSLSPMVPHIDDICVFLCCRMHLLYLGYIRNLYNIITSTYK